MLHAASSHHTHVNQSARAHHRGLTLAEVLIAIACTVVLAALGWLFLNANRHGPVSGILTKDATQIRGIHQSWLVYAREFEGLMPTPGMIDRLPFNGIEEPGRGEEDVTQNTTANLHSAMIMQNFYTPELCVGPTEPNPKVRVQAGDDYNYNAYKPASATYWDPTFTADLQTGSNVSYASMPIHGKRRATHWKETLDSIWPIVGNRGPLNGIHDPNSFTLRIHEPMDQWSGNVVFADNHVEFVVGLPSAKLGDGQTLNTQGLFRFDGEDDADGILTFVKSMSMDGPVIQHD